MSISKKRRKVEDKEIKQDEPVGSVFKECVSCHDLASPYFTTKGGICVCSPCLNGIKSRSASYKKVRIVEDLTTNELIFYFKLQ